MFKGFQNNRRSNGFNGFPALNFQMNNEAYGFSGCTFWLDAAYGTNTQTDLAAVSSWQSRIGGITFTQATAGNQPRLVLADPNFNNLPSIQCQDSSRHMISNYGGVNIDSSFTLAVVCKVDTNLQANAILGDSTSKTSDPYYIIYYGGSLSGWNGFGYYANGAIRLQGISESVTSKILIITNNTVMVNGSVESTGTILSDYAATLNVLFKYSNNNFAMGRTAEIISYNYILNSTEMTSLSTRLNSKYAIY